MYWQALADILPLVRRPISNHTILVSDCIREFTKRSQMLAVQFVHLRIEHEGECFFLSATNQSLVGEQRMTVYEFIGPAFPLPYGHSRRPLHCLELLLLAIEKN